MKKRQRKYWKTKKKQYEFHFEKQNVNYFPWSISSRIGINNKTLTGETLNIFLVESFSLNSATMSNIHFVWHICIASRKKVMQKRSNARHRTRKNETKAKFEIMYFCSDEKKKEKHLHRNLLTCIKPTVWMCEKNGIGFTELMQ